MLNLILKKNHNIYTLLFHLCHKNTFITGPRSPGPRSPSKKSIWAEESRAEMVLGRGVSEPTEEGRLFHIGIVLGKKEIFSASL